MARNQSPTIIGSSAIIASAFFFGTYGIWSKLMSPTFGEYTQGWTRAFILLLILIPLAIYQKQYRSMTSKDLIWLAVISLCGGLNQAPYYFAFAHLDIGLATLLFYASLTISGYILGKLVFHESITPIKLTSLILGLFGLFTVSNATIGYGQITATISAIIAGLMGGSEVVLTKKLSHQYSNLQILSAIFLTMFIGNIFLSSYFRESLPQLAINTAWLSQLGYTLSMLIAMYTVVVGFKYLNPTLGSILGLLEIIFAIAFGALLFGESITTTTLIGSILIISAAALPYLRLPHSRQLHT